ncbi:putative cytochrome P450 [Dioscorea sansibarensis]
MEFFSISSIYGLSVVCLSALLFFSVFAMVWIFWLMPVCKNNKLRKNGFRGPSPRFPFGNLMEMRNKALHQVPSSSSSSSNGDHSRNISHDIHSIAFSYFAQWRKTFGRVFVYWLGTEPFLHVSEPEFLKKVTSGSLSKSWGKPNVFKYDRRPMFGNGLIMVEGDEWDHHRHIIVPAFSIKNLNGMQNLMVETTTNMIEEWKKLIDMGKHEINVEEYIIRNAAEIIAKTSFGISEEDGKMVFQKLQTMQTMLFKSNRLVGVPFSKLLSPKESQEAWKLGKEIDKLLLRIITSRKDQTCTINVQQDLLSILLEGNQARKKKFTTQELVDEAKTFFFGGHETTALALTWTMFLLALYPQWQKLLREEIMEVSNGDPLDSTMLTKLIKMGWVFNETLRLYSPAPNAQRQAREDIKVGDIFIPKGTNMWIDIVAMHHDRELWGDDVHEFKPERFMDNNNGGCKHRMGFMPFGFGGRVCVGRNLSITEYKIVLSLILQKFSFSLSPSYLHSPKIMLSLRPSFGVPLIVHPI